jgi:hypothetical protein
MSLDALEHPAGMPTADDGRASSSTPEVSPVAPEGGDAPGATTSQPPTPVRPVELVGGQKEVDPQIRAAIEQVLAEQQRMAAEPPVEDPPDDLVVRQPREERINPSGRGTMFDKNEEWIRLPEPYEDKFLLMWVDFPRKLAREVDSREEGRVLAAAKKIILGHNSWADEEGILPHPGDDDFWERLAPRVTVHVIRSIIRVMIKLPNSPKPMSGKLSSGTG